METLALTARRIKHLSPGAVREPHCTMRLGAKFSFWELALVEFKYNTQKVVFTRIERIVVTSRPWESAVLDGEKLVVVA